MPIRHGLQADAATAANVPVGHVEATKGHVACPGRLKLWPSQGWQLLWPREAANVPAEHSWQDVIEEFSDENRPNGHSSHAVEFQKDPGAQQRASAQG